MAAIEVICPECQQPAVKWFDFGGRKELYSYYHCDACDLSCAVQYGSDGRLLRQSAWVPEKSGTAVSLK